MHDESQDGPCGRTWMLLAIGSHLHWSKVFWGGFGDCCAMLLEGYACVGTKLISNVGDKQDLGPRARPCRWFLFEVRAYIGLVSVVMLRSRDRLGRNEVSWCTKG